MAEVVLRRMNGEEIARGDDLIALVEANKADLSGANLYGANLYGAELTGAVLSGAVLSRVNMIEAYLTDADLSDADLTGAYLNRAFMSSTDLTCADLSNADLTVANLTGANFAGADLSGAVLAGAKLEDCIGNGDEIITVQTDIWTVTRTATVMQIGCQRHLISRWWEFIDNEIKAMDCRALEWWGRWKPILKAMIEAAPAKDTGSPSP